jgi:hypothetical protein
MIDSADSEEKWLVQSSIGKLWVKPFNAGFTTVLKAAGRFSQSQATEIADAHNRAERRFEVVLAPEFSETRKVAN